MITFLTLFLGLFAGRHTVELAAEPPVDRVELLLDGERVGLDAVPPFRFHLDFGDELAPHRLTAIGRDAEGAEVARATRDVNLIPREVGLEIALERGPDGEPRAARLKWRSVDLSPPQRLVLWLDGQPLSAADGYEAAISDRVPLPGLDLADIHFLTAEVYFATGAVARAERVFGGELGREIDTENTAVAVEVEGRRRLRRAEQAAGLVRVSDTPARVLAIEHGPAELVIVRERSAWRELTLLTAALQAVHFGSLSFGDWSEDRLFMVAPAPRHLLAGAHRAGAVPGLAGPFRIARKPDQLARQRGLRSGGVLAPGAARGGGDGGHARGHRRPAARRAPGDRTRGAAHDAGGGVRVRTFLERLRVPLAVWYVERDPQELTRRAWGEPVEDVGTLGALTDATRELRERVARQRILWIDGDHLPAEVSLAPGAPARLAGGAK